MGYRIVPSEGQYLVVDVVSGAVDSIHATRDAAVARIQALGPAIAAKERSERERLANDPAVKARRRQGAAYRLAGRDPTLRVLKQVLPREGEIARNTQRAYDHMLRWMDQSLSAAASDPRVHAELNKSPTQRQTSKAVAARRRCKATTEARVRALKKQGLRQVAIAKQLDLTPEWVSRILKKKKKN